MRGAHLWECDPLWLSADCAVFANRCTISSERIAMENPETQQSAQDLTAPARGQKQSDHTPGAGMMACPVCGHEMPDLKGGKATICPACGFKDSCCY